MSPSEVDCLLAGAYFSVLLLGVYMQYSVSCPFLIPYEPTCLKPPCTLSKAEKMAENSFFSDSASLLFLHLKENLFAKGKIFRT